jgi:secreted PhoX family phosphatase
MIGGLAAVAVGVHGAGLTGSAALAQSAAPSALLGFKAVPVSKEDTVVVPEGYKVQVLAPWGTPITGDMPAWNPGRTTAAEQLHQVGQHHDGMHFFPIDGSNEDGLIAVNHEYIEPRFIHAAKYKGMAADDSFVLVTDGKRDDDEVLAEIYAHGVSIYRTKRNAVGVWEVVADPHNRRIHRATPMAIGGPVRGSAHVRT